MKNKDKLFFLLYEVDNIIPAFYYYVIYLIPAPLEIRPEFISPYVPHSGAKYCGRNPY